MSKKILMRLFAAFLAIITFLVQLPLGYLTFATENDNQAEQYPQRVIYKFNADMEYACDSFSDQSDKKVFSDSIDFKNISYDYFEFDVLVSSGQESEVFKLTLYDSSDKSSSYEIDLLSNVDSHFKVTADEFIGVADLADICGYALTDIKKNVIYKLSNLCFTGIESPSASDMEDAVHLNKRIDVTDTNKSSTSSSVFSFDDVSSVDFLAEDWVEFDLYVLSDDSSVDTVMPSITFVDKDYTASSKNNNQCYYKAEVKTGQWQHFKISTRSFKIYSRKTCDKNNIVGVCIFSMKDNFRYILANLCLYTIKISAPDILEQSKVLKGGIFSEYYCEGENGKTPVSGTEQNVDISDFDHIRFDVYIDSGHNDISTADVTLLDNNGNEASLEVKLKSGEWVGVKLPIRAFDKNGFDKKAFNGMYLSGLKENSRYFVANLYLTNSEYIFDDGSPENALEVKDFSLDYYKKENGNDIESIAGFAPIDITDYDIMQFDAFVDAPEHSGELPNELKIALVDTFSNEFTVTVKYNNNTIQENLKVQLHNISNVDTRKICAVYIVETQDNFFYKLRNLCFIKITPPKLEDNVDIESVLEPNPIVSYQDFTVKNTFNSPIKFDNSKTVDITKGDYIEFDMYIAMDESRSDYSQQQTVTLFLCDETYVAKNYGRAGAAVTAEVNKWQHFKIQIDSFIVKNGWNGNKEQMISFMVETPKTTGLRYIVANMCSTVNKAFRDYKGEYPSNATDFRVDNALDWVVSSGFWASYTPIEPAIDVKSADYIKFDVFAFSDNADSERIQFSVGNCARGEWKARAFAVVTIKTNEWQTVKIKISDLNTLTLGVDLDLTNAIMYSLDTVDKTANKIVLRKLCTVKRKSAVEPDKADKPSVPDTNSRYISDCDAPSNEMGVWNSVSGYFIQDYKTEGKGSLALKVYSDSDPQSHSFLFYSQADFSSSETINFDMFVDDVTLASKCVFKILLSNDKRLESGNFTYVIPSSVVSLGWNSLQVKLSDFKADSDADISAVRSMAFMVETNNFSEDDYFVFGIDNLRVGKSFVMVDDEKNSDSNVMGDFSANNTVIYAEPDVIELDPQETTTYINKKVIKKQKVVLENISAAHWVIMIVTLIVSAILIVGSVILVCVFKRKERRGEIDVQA